jgi:hypothetical protein
MPTDFKDVFAVLPSPEDRSDDDDDDDSPVTESSEEGDGDNGREPRSDDRKTSAERNSSPRSWVVSKDKEDREAAKATELSEANTSKKQSEVQSTVQSTVQSDTQSQPKSEEPSEEKK